LEFSPAGFVQSKSVTVGYAVSLILSEFDRIRKEQVTDAEMETAIMIVGDREPGSLSYQGGFLYNEGPLTEVS